MAAEESSLNLISELDPEAEKAVDRRVGAALVGNLYRGNITALVVQPTGAVIVAAILRKSVPSPLLAGWLLAFLIVMAARTLVWLWHRRTKPGVEHSRRWATRFLIGTWATGALWGFASLAFLSYLQPREETFLVVITVGAAVAGLSSLCADRRVISGYLISAIMPIGLAYALIRQEWPLFVLTVIFLAYTLLIGWQIHSFLARTLRLSFQGEILVERLIHARAAAEASSRAKSDFLAHMSHELRTPLNAILGFSQVMEEKVYGPLGASQYSEYARLIRHSGQHLLDLITDILDYSKGEEGKLELHEEDVDIPAVVEEAAALMRDNMVAAGITFVERSTRSLPNFRGDRRKLRQILLNLLSNAAKFTPSGGTVRMSTAVEPSGELIFEVSDTGIGIAPENLDRVFTPFVQVDNVLARRHQGTGLGLPLTKQFVELHGGTLAIESKPGVGTLVKARFPAARLGG